MASDTLKYSTDETAQDSGRSADLSLLVVHSPDSAVIGTRLAPGESHMVLVGRAPERGLRVNDARISKLHLRVVSASGELSFADAGSSNGTFLNGEAAHEGALVRSDVLRIGDTLLVVAEDAMASLDNLAGQAARSTLPVLILGETGTGKEVLARSIHQLSGRSGDFVAVNCAALHRELATAELFGHVRGAFSGADTARDGLFRAADGGTIFLDEIGDLPRDLQPALLRVLQERKVRPLGTDREAPVDARVIAATHVDLDQAVDSHTFRADLLGRLAHVVLRMPPLRARRGELLDLARRFGEDKPLSADAAEALLLWNWPRNIRELRAVVTSAILNCGERPAVRLKDVAERVPEAALLIQSRRQTLASRGDSPPQVTPTPAPEQLGLESHRERLQGELAAAERELILRTVQQAGTQAAAAKKLGISRRTLINRLVEYGIARPRKNRGTENE